MEPTTKLYGFNIESKQTKFCVAPWSIEQIDPDGSQGLCCYRSGNDDLEWNSSHMKQLRLDMLAERSNKICEKCDIEEKVGFPSFRTIYNNATTLWANKDLEEVKRQAVSVTDIKTGHVNTNPQILSLALGNTCTGQCNICSPWNSSALYRVWKNVDKELDYNSTAFYTTDVYKWVNDDQYWEENIYPKFSNLVNLNVLGGEPFIINRYVKLLKYCVDNNLAKDICHYVNTGCFKKPSSEIIDLWKHFKAVQLELSIDDIKERNEYIRYPVKWSNTLEFLNWCDNETDDNVYISMNKTVQNLNMFYVPDMIDWILDQKFKKINKFSGGIPFHSVCHQPERSGIKNLPLNLKQLIRDKYQAWYEKFEHHYKVNSNDPQIVDNAEYQIQRVMKLLDLMDEDCEQQFKDIQDWSIALDKQRETDYLEAFPIFKEVI